MSTLIFEVTVRVTADVVYRIECSDAEDARLAAVALAYNNSDSARSTIRTVTCVPRCEKVGERCDV